MIAFTSEMRAQWRVNFNCQVYLLQLLRDWKNYHCGSRGVRGHIGSSVIWTSSTDCHSGDQCQLRPQNVWLFPFPQCTVTCKSGQRSVQGKTGDIVMICTWTDVVGSFLLGTQPLLWSMISGSENWFRSGK